MSQQSKQQGFLATEEGKKKLREVQKRKSEELGEKYTQKKIAKDAYVSLQVVKNLFNPQYKRNVSKEVVEAIAAVLDLLPEEIVGKDAWFPTIIPCKDAKFCVPTFQENRQAVIEFLQAIETRFQYLKLFHRQEKVLLQNQYIPIEVTLERRYKHENETTWGYAESEAELQKVYALKGMAEETRKEQVKWEKARKKHQRLIVLADPGMGKSTLLRMEALQIAGKQLDPPKSPLEKGTLNQNLAIEEIIFPLFLRLSELAERAGEIIEILPELINREYAKTAPAIESLLRQKLEKGKCVLLLDALDEVPKEQRQKLKEKLKRFADNYDCPIVFTSRIVGYGGAFLDGAKEVEIVPFNKQQREAYITSWFTNAAEYLADETVSPQGLIRELQNKPQISGLAQNPLLLSLLCSLYQEKELVLPARRCEVYTQAVEYMLGKWRNDNQRQPQGKGFLRAKVRLLEKLAFEFSCGEKEVFSDDDLYDLIEEFLQGEKLPKVWRDKDEDDVIGELTEVDGIIQHLPGTDNKYLFLHRTFQEYFTASYLKRVIEEDEARGIELAREHFWEFDWHETLSLLAGLLDNPEPLLAAIVQGKDDIFRHQLLLAGKCVAECEESKDGLVEEVIEGVYESWKSSLYHSWFDSKVVLLGKTHNQMFQCLLKDLEDADSNVRKSAVKVLENIGNSQCTYGLICALNDSKNIVRWSAAYALGHIGDSQGTSALISSALNDSDINVVRAAEYALRNIRDSQGTSYLISALNDSYLVSALSDSDRYIRLEAAITLGKIGDIRGTSALITALNDSKITVRWFIAQALGKIGDIQAVSALIIALTDSDSNVRRSAASALGKIGDIQAVSALIIALTDSDSNVRRSAALALGEIGDIQAVSALIIALTDSDKDVRRAAAYSLENIGSNQAVSALISALTDSDKDVRRAAAQALGRIGDRQATSTLISTLNDFSSNVRKAAAIALRNIGDIQAVSALIIALNDSDKDVRRLALKALANIGNPQSLKQILQNPKINIYDEDIFPHLRKLAVRHSKAKVDFIPVYPETVDLLREQGTGNRQQRK